MTENPTHQAGNWESITLPWVSTATSTFGMIPHSIMGGLVVGNFQDTGQAGTGFIYNIANKTAESVTVYNARYTTIYGIWANGGESYTIVGGFTDSSDGIISAAFIADYRPLIGLTHLTPYYDNNNPDSAILTHFEGVTTDGNAGCLSRIGSVRSEWLSSNYSDQLVLIILKQQKSCALKGTAFLG